MSTNDYVKFVTQQFVKFIDQPKEVRKATRKQRKEEQLPLTNRWFGIMPFAVSLMFKKNKKRES